MATNSIKLLTGNSHPQLAKLVADRSVFADAWANCLGVMLLKEEQLMISRLGIELAKTMSLNYSNQETSVTVGESVRDEDGVSLVLFNNYSWELLLTPLSLHPPIHRPW